jgi:carboxymethylenebutenolidase
VLIIAARAGNVARMCFPFDAVPPDVPAALLRDRRRIAGGAAGERLTLTSADGIPFSAYLARVEPGAEGGDAGVVILPDVRGLFRFYEELAERFADAGIPAIAIDYFGRTAGLGPRDEDFDYTPHVQQARSETIAMDVRAAVERLKAETGAARIFTVGFCFGGAQSFVQAAARHGLAGVIGFYGILAPRPGRPSPIDVAPSYEAPVLALFGGGDDHIPQDHIDRFDAALTEAGVEHEIHVYPGAPHSFFDRRQEQYAEASADAWERVLRFIGKARVEA